MQIEILVGHYDRMIGLAWYAAALQKYLSSIGANFRVIQPEFPRLIRVAHTLLSPLGYDLKAFFSTYPIAAQLGQRTIKHFSAQQMASLLSFQKGLKPTVITVHDIIPFLTRDDLEQRNYHLFYDRRFDELAMNNLRRADRIIAVSEFTRRTLIEKLGIPESQIRVVLHGLDHDVFKPTEVLDEFRRKFQINPDWQYILYVGSELPRKNLNHLLEAFAIVKNKNPHARLIKIGSPIQDEYFKIFREQIERLNLQNEIILLDHVSRDDLISFYNLADVFVFPSYYEGFGLPPLEAMACGAPVICSNSTSLPEVVGDAAILIDPRDVAGWSESICRVLGDMALRNYLQAKSKAQAAQFTWERMAEETMSVYKEVEYLCSEAGLN